jgi:hypothetical protein
MNSRNTQPMRRPLSNCANSAQGRPRLSVAVSRIDTRSSFGSVPMMLPFGEARTLSGVPVGS